MVDVIAEPETAGEDGVAVQGNLRCGLQAQVESRDCDGHRVVKSRGGVGQVEVGERVFERETQQAGVVLRFGGAFQLDYESVLVDGIRERTLQLVRLDRAGPNQLHKGFGVCGQLIEGSQCRRVLRIAVEGREALR